MSTKESLVYLKWWRLGVALIAEDKESRPLYIEGKQVPQRKYESGEFYVKDWTAARARYKYEKDARKKYGADLVDIAFVNTEPVEESKVPEEFISGSAKLLSYFSAE